MNVGFVGLGVMGAPMAHNLLKAGFPVKAYNRTSSRVEPLVAAGARTAGSPAEAALGSDVVITMLSDTPVVEEILFRPGGVAAGLRAGGTVIDMSTISPRSTIRFAERLRAAGIDMLDAPVSGGEAGAREARLSIMVGGERAVFERCLPLFRAMGRNVVYCGSGGTGQKTKLVNQVVTSMNLLAAVEGLRLAKASGLDPQVTLEAVGAGAAGSWMWSNLGPKIVAGDTAPGFSIRLQEKDLRLVTEMWRELGLEAPGATLAHQLFKTAVEEGFGDLGNQALFLLWS